MKTHIFNPNIFQQEALEEIDKAIAANIKAFIVVMPPGTGKTYLAAQWFRLQLEKNPKARLLYICHNQDILSQANDKEFERCLAELDIPRGYYNKSEKDIGQVTFATVQTLRKNLDVLPSDYFDYIIVDEAHHYRAKSFETAIKHFDPKVLLGLTATPNRMDGKSILSVFGKIIYNAPIIKGIKNGLLCKIKYYFVENDIDFSVIKTKTNGKYDEKDLNKKIFIKEYDEAIIKEYAEILKYGKKKTICFCASVEHAYRMEKLFNDNGFKAVYLTGKYFSASGKKRDIPHGRRKDIIDGFKNSEYDIIFVRDLFNEGIDIPDADCIMMLRSTDSSRIFTQQIGRGLRVSKNKEYLLVLDFTGNCYRCNIEVLGEIIDVDNIERIRDKNQNGCDSLETIIHDLFSDVSLIKNEIDIISMSEQNAIKDRKNIIFVPDYIPKNPLPGFEFETSDKEPNPNIDMYYGNKYTDSPEKEKIRIKVIEKIQDGNSVIILESPELGTLKEIERQGKNPKKIIIPNHQEYDDLRKALEGYITDLNIEVINTSVIQYIVDHPEDYFNLIWLDYCGPFSFYKRDLDIIFQREIKEMKLIVTYNSFDPKKIQDGHYFTNVIGYVLKKYFEMKHGKNEILLMEDVSQIYKKRMFSIGFDIREL